MSSDSSVQPTSHDSSHCDQRNWDAIIIGSGMGGSAAAWALARNGWSVLVLECGLDHRSNSNAIRGRMVEEPLPGELTSRLADGGRDASAITLDDGHRRFCHHAFIGSGSGGSSAIYGAALERFHPEDLMPRHFHAGAAGSDLPEAWPFPYHSLLPWYEIAETRLGVVGGEMLNADSLHHLSPANAVLARHLLSRGLRPERLHLGDRDDGSSGTTQGMLCPRGRKHDAARAFLYPAMDEHGAVLLDRCRVLRLDSDGAKVTRVVAERAGSRLDLRARHVLLAGGALRTPGLLLASPMRGHEAGLSNGSGWVGRGLMRHFIDLYAVRVGGGLAPYGYKQLASNHWYLRDGVKLGTLQSFGPLPPPAILARTMRATAHENGRFLAAWALGLSEPILRRAIGWALSGREVLATIIEDLPYRDNAVSWTPEGGIAVRYRLQPEARQRIAVMRQHMLEMLKGLPTRLIPAAEDLRRLAHACGTCRAGNDPANSVVDCWCRCHELTNLHIVDGSWMPSSGGTNPGLTIAANALRVADHLICENGDGMTINRNNAAYP